MILTLASEQELTADFRQVLTEVFRLHGWTDADELWLVNTPGEVDLALGTCKDFSPRVQTVSVAETMGTAGGKTKLSWAVRQLLKPYVPRKFKWYRVFSEGDFLPFLAEQRWPEDTLVALDIEVSGDIRVDEPEDTELLSVSFAWLRHSDATIQGVVLGKDDLQTREGREAVLQVVENNRLLTHNGKFDLRWVNALLGTNVKPAEDTMLLHHSMFPGAGEHGLKPLARRILGAPDWESGAKAYLKGSKAHFERIPQELLTEYNAWDVFWTYSLFEELTRLCSEDARRVYEHELAAGEMLQDVEAHGMNVDLEYADKLDDFYASARENALAGVQGFVENPNSVPQVKAAVKKHFGITLGGTSEQTLKKALSLEKPGYAEFVGDLLALRGATKARSTYITSILNKVRRGRVHPTFLVHGTTTGRLSSSGPNVQNVTNDGKGGMSVRRMYVAPEGYTLVGADYAQAELRVMAELSGDERMIADLQEDSPDFFDNIIPSIFPDVDFEGSDKAFRHPYRLKSKRTIYGCVPLSTKILTRRGWLAHNEVVPGDETVGMDPVTGLAHWTRITAVNHYGEQPVGSLHNARWGFDVTPGHRWVIRKRNSTGNTMQTTDALKGDDTILTHAPVQDMHNEVPNFSLDEMRLLTWLLTDGYLKINPFTGITSQGKFGQRRKVFASIQQAKPLYVTEIAELLARLEMDPGTVQKRPGVNYDAAYSWALPAEKIRALLRRIEFMDRGGVPGADFDIDKRLVEWLLTLPIEYIEAFYDVFLKAEGHKQGNRWIVTQNPGGRMDAIELAATLLGYSTTRIDHGESCQRLLVHKNPFVTCQRVTYQPDRVEEVWCPTTELGTWTAKQVDGRIAITGNTSYGLTCMSISEMLSLDGHPTSIQEAAKMQDNYLGYYPGLQKWRNDTLPLVLNGDDLTTPFGRRFQQDVIVNDRRALSRVQNQSWAFRPQSAASDICVRAAVNLWREFADTHKYKDCHIIALVHDAIYPEVPEELGEEVRLLTEKHMRESGAMTYNRVPLLTDSHAARTWDQC